MQPSNLLIAMLTCGALVLSACDSASADKDGVETEDDAPSDASDTDDDNTDDTEGSSDTDTMDVDGDGYSFKVDCDDTDDSVYPGADDDYGDGVDQNCDGVDGVDDDQDGWAGEASGGRDCDDGDAEVHPAAVETCGDVDADCDGLVGCDDDDCLSEDCAEDCENGWDDDVDGLVDCEDGDCVSEAVCIEQCDNGLDDDVDGATDCADDDCIADPACLTMQGIRVLGGHLSYKVREEVVDTWWWREWEDECRTSFGSPSGGRETDYYGLSLSGSNLSGLISFSDGAGAPGSCHWTLQQVSGSDNGTFDMFSPSMAYRVKFTPTRSGFSTTGACGGLTSAQVLPQQFEFYDARSHALGVDGQSSWYVAGSPEPVVQSFSTVQRSTFETSYAKCTYVGSSSGVSWVSYGMFRSEGKSRDFSREETWSFSGSLAEGGVYLVP